MIRRAFWIWLCLINAAMLSQNIYLAGLQVEFLGKKPQTFMIPIASLQPIQPLRMFNHQSTHPSYQSKWWVFHLITCGSILQHYTSTNSRGKLNRQLSRFKLRQYHFHDLSLARTFIFMYEFYYLVPSSCTYRSQVNNVQTVCKQCENSLQCVIINVKLASS